MIKVIISLLNFLGIYHPCATWYKIVLPWQHRDCRTITVLSLVLRPLESGQLSIIIPQNYGITTTKMIPIAGRASSVLEKVLYTSVRFQKHNRKEKEETIEQQTYQFTTR